jgi:CMP/dCMP kinase
MERSVPVLAIDGPGGSGKGTISRRVAQRLGWHLLDSGALYRLVALAGHQQGLSLEDVSGHAALAASLPIRFSFDQRGDEQVWIGSPEVEVAAAIRSEEAGQGASRVAQWPEVRSALLARQRAFAQEPGLVADGRDMGSVVFPQARLKIYLTASPEERAQRRYKQLKDKGSGVNLAALSRELAERDLRDRTRPVAPLVPAPDAVILDSTGMSVEAVVEKVLLELSQRMSVA